MTAAYAPSKEWREGFDHGASNLNGSDCPYAGGTIECHEWCRGWHAGRASNRETGSVQSRAMKRVWDARKS